MVQTYKIVTGKGGMVNSETWFTSVTESGRPTRSTAGATSIQAGDQKAIFLTKSGRELEQDPCQSIASQES
jgi:hypothetical protein